MACPHAAGRPFTSYSPQISEADLSTKLQSLPDSNILMVEVENIHHEQFTVNEEVKVRKASLEEATLASWSQSAGEPVTLQRLFDFTGVDS